MLPVKADLAICSLVIWIVLECGFHVKDFSSSVIVPGFGKSCIAQNSGREKLR